jgi:predicted metal-dependent phosphoesterase TrpH
MECLKKYQLAYVAANKEKVYERVHKYYREHKEEVLKKAKLWREKNKERHKRNLKAYFEKHPDYFRKRRAKLKAARSKDCSRSETHQASCR